MRRFTAMLVCFLVCAEGARGATTLAPGQRPDMATLIDARWEGLSAFELVKRVDEDFIKLQTEDIQHQWTAWRAAIGKVRDAVAQREMLIKTGLPESTTGECKVALQELLVLLEPTRSMGKRLDRAMKREKHVQLADWSPIYDLIVKEDFKTAAEKLDAFKLDEEHSSVLIKAFFPRLKIVIKEDMAAQKAAEEKKSAPPAPAPAPTPAPDKPAAAPEKKADDPAPPPAAKEEKKP